MGDFATSERYSLRLECLRLATAIVNSPTRPAGDAATAAREAVKIAGDMAAFISHAVEIDGKPAAAGAPVPERESMLAEALATIVRSLSSGDEVSVGLAKDAAVKALLDAGWTFTETYEVAGGRLHPHPPADEE